MNTGHAMPATPGPFPLSRAGGLKRLLLIVPAAHVRIHDGEFQGQLYELFHTRPVAQWGHLLFTPLILAGMLAPLVEFGIAYTLFEQHLVLNGAVLAGLLVLALHVFLYGAWAIISAPMVTLSVVVANALHGVLADQLLAGSLLVAWGAALAQTLSHVSEPLPPPWSGGTGFLPMREFLPRAPLSSIALLALLTVAFYPLLELWAAIRIPPLIMAQLAGRFGFMKARTLRMQAWIRNREPGAD